jgi:tetratricopeptide (TPR) repeat protein
MYYKRFPIIINILSCSIILIPSIFFPFIISPLEGAKLYSYIILGAICIFYTGFLFLKYTIPVTLETLSKSPITYITLSAVISTFLVKFDGITYAFSPIQTIFTHTLSLVTVFTCIISTLLIIMSFTNKNLHNTLRISGQLAAFFSVLWFINPFTNLTQSTDVAFLTSSLSHSIGGSLQQIAFFSFCLISLIILSQRKLYTPEHIALSIICGGLVLNIGLFISDTIMQKDMFLGLYTHYVYSAKLASTILSSLSTALFGVGIGNMGNYFISIKDEVFALSPLYTTSTFQAAPSALLHSIIELGLFGIGSISYFFYTLYNSITHKTLPLYILLVAIFALLPFSIITFLITSFGVAIIYLNQKDYALVIKNKFKKRYVFLPVGFALISFIILLFTIINVTSELFFIKSLHTLDTSINDSIENAKVANKLVPKNTYILLQSTAIINKQIAQYPDIQSVVKANNPEFITTMSDALQQVQNVADVSTNTVELNQAATIYTSAIGYVKDADIQVIKILSSTLKGDPYYSATYSHLAALYTSLDKNTEALQVLQNAHKIFPAAHDITYMLSTTYFSLAQKKTDKTLKKQYYTSSADTLTRLIFQLQDAPGTDSTITTLKEELVIISEQMSKIK